MSLGSLWPWAIVSAVIGIVIFVAVVVIVLRASRAKTPMVPLGTPGAPTEAAAAAAPAVIRTSAFAVRRSFANAMRSLKEQAGGAADRLAMPWVLSIGEAGAGKSTMINSLTIPRLPGVAPDPDAAENPCAWGFFEQGVVLDVAGTLVLDPDGVDDRAWKAVITQLQRYRPERPLDAVLLSIPSTDLVGPHRLSKDAVATKGTHLAERLSELQRALGLRLPVYIVVTKCDRIPGFSAFCRAVPSRRVEDILGWSSPYSVDAAFGPAWVDEAMDAVLSGMQEAEFAALARETIPSSGEQLVMLSLHVGRARSPLREYLQRIFRSTAFEQGAFLRGIYLTGDRDARTDSDEPALPVVGSARRESTMIPAVDAWLVPDAAPQPEGATPERRPAFLRDLFVDKIFGERGLARPGPWAFPSKNRTVAAMQIATAAIIVLGPVALYASAEGVRLGPWRVTNGVRADAQSFKPLLQNIDVAMHQMHERRNVFRTAAYQPGQDVNVFRLLDDMASIGTSHLGSLLLPGSIFSPLQGEISDAIGLSFEAIILPEFHDRLTYRARRIVDPSVKAISQDPTFGQNLSLPQYLSDLATLSTAIEHFNDMATAGKGDLKDLVHVVQYLYNEQVSADFLENGEYYARALNRSKFSGIKADSTTPVAAVHRAGELTRASYLALLERLSASSVDAPAVDAQQVSRNDVDALVGLRAFLDTAGPVERALANVHPPFFFGDHFAAFARDTLTFYTQQLAGQLLPRYADAGHSTDASLRVLDALLKQRFMQAPSGRRIGADLRPGSELTWDLPRLDEALVLQTEFDTFIAHGLDPLPEALRNRVRRLATVQLVAVMNDAVFSAERIRPTLSAVASAGGRDLPARIAAFEQGATRMTKLLEEFDAIGATSTYDALADLGSIQATALLTQIEGDLDLANRFRLPPGAAGAWNGQAPFTAALFGGRAGALDEYVAAEQESLREAAHLARPLVVFLETRSPDGARRPAQLRTWDAVITAVDKLERKPPAGPLVAIDATLRMDLDSIDVKTCARRSARPGTGADVFTQRADAIWNSVWRRCVDIALADVVASYGRLQHTFATRLAGRFPFAAPEAGTDAAPTDVVEFLREFDAFAARARQTATPDAPYGPAVTRAESFLADIAKVRAFLAPLVDSAAAGRPPVYDYQIDFRVNRAREFGASQIAEWTADVGDQHAAQGAPPAARRGRWRGGDDIVLTMRWATGSPFAPAEPAVVGASVNGATMFVTEAGYWSLLRLLRQYESDTSDPDGGHTVKIAVRTNRRGATGEPTGAARAFLRVRLFNPDNRGEVMMPRFPAAAPDLRAEDAR